MTTDPNATVPMVERLQFAYRVLRDAERHLKESLSRIDAAAERANAKKADLTAFIRRQTPLPELLAERLAAEASTFAELDEQIAEPERARAQLVELSAKVTEARHALARAERDAGIVPNPWGVAR